MVIPNSAAVTAASAILTQNPAPTSCLTSISMLEAPGVASRCGPHLHSWLTEPDTPTLNVTHQQFNGQYQVKRTRLSRRQLTAWLLKRTPAGLTIGHPRTTRSPAGRGRQPP